MQPIEDSRLRFRQRCGRLWAEGFETVCLQQSGPVFELVAAPISTLRAVLFLFRLRIQCLPDLSVLVDARQ